MKKIYWDTMLYAYLLEGNPHFGPRVKQIRATMQARGDVLCGSLFVVGELLVKPMKTGDTRAADVIERFFHSSQLSLVGFSDGAERVFSELRAHHGVKGMDALHLAIAARNGIDLFLTNDAGLQRLVMPGLPFIASLDTALFPKN